MPKWHLQLLLCKPDVNNKDKLCFVQTYCQDSWHQLEHIFLLFLLFLLFDLSKCTKATAHSSKIDGWHLLHKSYVSYLFSPLNGLLGVLYRSIWGTSSI